MAYLPFRVTQNCFHFRWPTSSNLRSLCTVSKGLKESHPARLTTPFSSQTASPAALDTQGLLDYCSLFPLRSSRANLLVHLLLEADRSSAPSWSSCRCSAAKHRYPNEGHWQSHCGYSVTESESGFEACRLERSESWRPERENWYRQWGHPHHYRSNRRAHYISAPTTTAKEKYCIFMMNLSVYLWPSISNFLKPL